jgi:hypothetical protein
MRLCLAAAIVSAPLLPMTAMADEQKVEASTLDAIATLATKGYRQPAAASLRNIHKSLARNGLGYCGEVSLDGGGGFTVFHVILAGNDSPASVLKLSDYPDNDRSRNAVAVRRLMVSFGCLEPEPPPAVEPDTR